MTVDGLRGEPAALLQLCLSICTLSLLIYRQKQKDGKKKKPRTHKDEVASARITWDHDDIKNNRNHSKTEEKTPCS